MALSATVIFTELVVFSTVIWSAVLLARIGSSLTDVVALIKA